MKLYAKSLHIYWDAENHIEYRIPAGESLEVPDHIASYLIENHPDKLSRYQEPAQAFATTQVVQTEDRQMRPRRTRIPNSRGEVA